MPRLSKRRLRTAIKSAMLAAQVEVSGHAGRGGLYAGGVASEGYSGGYRDALQDVLLLIGDVTPNRRDYWKVNPDA